MQIARKSELREFLFTFAKFAQFATFALSLCLYSSNAFGKTLIFESSNLGGFVVNQNISPPTPHFPLLTFPSYPHLISQNDLC